MSLSTPTTKETADLIIAQLETTLGQTIPFLPKSFLRVLAKTLSGVFVLLYKYAGFMFLQMFVSTASFKGTTINGRTLRPLVEWGRLLGVGDPTAATRAELLIEIAVENQTGTLPAGAQLVGPDNGVTYVTLSSIALDAATKQAIVRAVSDQGGTGGAGVIGNLDPGAVVSFANPIANVSRNATVVSQSVTAANAETEAAYRQRVVTRFQAVPQGGAYADYTIWGESVEGIVNVYPYTGVPGEVIVYIEATVASSGDPDGFPTLAQIQAVEDAIYLNDRGAATRAPVGVLVTGASITRAVFDVQVTSLAVDDPVAVQAEISDALDFYFQQREPYIVGVSVPPAYDLVVATEVTGIVSQVVAAAGGTFDSLAVTESAVPVTVRQLVEGEKAKLGVVSYV